MGVTKPDIRRLARRGGIKRISGSIYNETRLVLRIYLEKLLFDMCAIVEMCKRKTVCTTDVVWALQRQGRTLYVSAMRTFDTMICSQLLTWIQGFGSAQHRGVDERR
jgi:histone H3/H4